MLHQNSKGENCSASHKACGAEGKEGVLQQTMHTACVSVESYVLIYFQSADIKWSRTEPVWHIFENILTDSE